MTGDFQHALAHDAQAITVYLSREIDEMGHVPPRLTDAMRLALLGGGKRVRPFLVMETASLFGIERARAMPVAAALECVHCYSLVHDDLPAMDNDKLRRGKPTVWAAYDEWTAILAGDALLTVAFEMCARGSCHPDPAVRSLLGLELARAAGPAGMVAGQCLDLQSDKLATPAAPDEAYIRQMQSLKTGALLQFACEAGAIIAKASRADRQRLRDFGGHLGYAFQIADDLLDIEGTPDVVGKATGKDAAQGKATLASVRGVAAAREELGNVETAALAVLEPFGPPADGLRAVMRFVVARRS